MRRAWVDGDFCTSALRRDLSYHERDTLVGCSTSSGPDDSENHIARHGVTPEEVEQSTHRPFYTMTGRDGTTLLFGQTYAGRFLLVVLAQASDGRWYVVTARTMTVSERQIYKKKAQ